MTRCALALVFFTAVPALAQTRASAVFLDGTSSQVLVHDSVKLNATAYDSSGAPIPSAQFTWTVSDRTVFTVDSKGLVQAIGLGWADITAATGASGTVRLQAVPSNIIVKPANQTVTAGDSLQYSADVLDVNGDPVPNVSLQWRVYGPNAGQDNVIQVDGNGLVTTFGWGTFYVEAYFNYTVGSGPFIPRFFANTTLTCVPRKTFQPKKLLDGTPVRQSFELRPHRGAINVNDSGQIAYVGFLEGLTPAALLWKGSAFTAIAVGGTPAELPGTNLQDVDTMALNNNGEVAARCIVASPRNCLLFAGSDGVPHTLFFDGSAAGGVTNLRNFFVTRFSLNDSSAILFRADYWNFGSTVNQTGLFTVFPSGAATLVVAAGTKLPGMAAPYTFNSDFGIANDGSVLFSVNSGSSNALYRLGPDQSITRVIGTGDQLNGSAVISIGSVAVGKNGHYAVMANNGTQNLLLFQGDPAKFRQLPINSYNTVFAVSGAGEVVVWCSLSDGYGLYRWDGARTRTVALYGFASPIGDPYTQFDGAGITAAGDVIVQARTANSLLLVVNAGAGMGTPSSIVFQSGARVNVSAGPSFYNLVMNGHTGNPMIKTGWYVQDVFEVAGGMLVPRLVSGDRTPDGWFFEGNQDVRRNGDGDLLVSTDQSISQIGAKAALLAHFPQHTANGNLNSAFQVGGNTSGTAVGVGGTSFGVQHLSVIQNGTATPLAWLGASGSVKTAAPGGGNFAGSNDVGVTDDGTVYASLRVTGGSDGLFTWTGSAWKALLRIGDPYDGFNVTSIGTIRVAGKALYAIVNSGFQHLARYQDGQWSDVISYGDGIPAGGTVTGFGAFDVNRNGVVAAQLYSNSGVQYLVVLDGNGMRVAGDNNHILDNGEVLSNIFQVSIHDDGRIFATAINSQELMVLYEFDPVQ
jgi:Bacterial Ig-like domain (group 2)